MKLWTITTKKERIVFNIDKPNIKPPILLSPKNKCSLTSIINFIDKQISEKNNNVTIKKYSTNPPTGKKIKEPFLKSIDLNVIEDKENKLKKQEKTKGYSITSNKIIISDTPNPKLDHIINENVNKSLTDKKNDYQNTLKFPISNSYLLEEIDSIFIIKCPSLINSLLFI